MTKRTVLPWALAGALAVWVGLAAGAAPSLDELGSLPAEGALSRSAVDTVNRYVKQWVDALVAAKTADEVIGARRALVRGYEVQSSRTYRYEYARAVSRHVGPALSIGNDPLKPVKEVNAGMAVAGMTQITIQPALERMARHGNPGVRYWAMKGYRAVGKLLLLQKAGYARRMLTTLERIGLKDPSGPVVDGALHAASGYPELGGEEAGKLRAVLDRIWLARCEGVHGGEVDLVEAYRSAVNYLPATDEAERKLALQLLADVLEAASRAFVREDNQAGRTGGLLAELLGRIEQRLAPLTGSERKPLQAALADREKPLDLKAAQIRLRTNDYWKPLLARQGVKVRFEPPATPLTRPATAPAGG